MPFGRHRWVSPRGQSDLEIVETPRPREEFDAWLGEQANTPLDAEHGPGWHLAVLPFTDGGAGVSFVISHCLIDGVGLCEALADAASGRDDPVIWPAAGSRRRWQALREDARQIARDIPAIGRAAVAAARFARRNRGGDRSGTRLPGAPSSPFAGADERRHSPNGNDLRRRRRVGCPRALTRGDQQRAARGIGGPPRPASGTGHRRRLSHLGDTRQRAHRRRYSRQRDHKLDIMVDPAPATTDLRGIRAAIKQALIRRQEVPDERLALLPLAPLLPQWLVRRMVSVAAGSTTSVVSSNLGDVNPATYRPDGTDADHFAIKGCKLGVTKAMMRRTGGTLALLSGRVDRQVFLSTLAYQPGRPNSNDELQWILSSTMDDFCLTASIGWPRP